jgi:hypothetical protein
LAKNEKNISNKRIKLSTLKNGTSRNSRMITSKLKPSHAPKITTSCTSKMAR